jgi:hypothetical protein
VRKAKTTLNSIKGTFMFPGEIWMQTRQKLLFRLVLSAAFLVAITALGRPAKADTITFDTPPSPGAVQLSSAVFQGFTFSTPGSFNHVASGTFSAAVSNNATSFLVLAAGAGQGALMANGGAAFSLNSFAADTFVHLQGATTITALGTFADGSTISQTFITDAIGDGPGPLADFQTFTVNGFTNVVSVQFTSSNFTFALDNVDVTTATTTVPEPTTIMLLGGGLTGLAGVIRRRRQSDKLTASGNSSQE